MGSGSFPLEIIGNSINDGDVLSVAAKMVEAVVESWYHDVYTGESGGRQFDNAARDGGALAELELAVELIRKNCKER